MNFPSGKCTYASVGRLLLLWSVTGGMPRPPGELHVLHVHAAAATAVVHIIQVFARRYVSGIVSARRLRRCLFLVVPLRFGIEDFLVMRYQDFHDHIVELQIHDRSDRLFLGTEQRRAEADAQIADGHQVLVALGGNAAIRTKS